jgi:hypothetical protein
MTQAAQEVDRWPLSDSWGFSSTHMPMDSARVCEIVGRMAAEVLCEVQAGTWRPPATLRINQGGAHSWASEADLGARGLAPPDAASPTGPRSSRSGWDNLVRWPRVDRVRVHGGVRVQSAAGRRRPHRNGRSALTERPGESGGSGCCLAGLGEGSSLTVVGILEFCGRNVPADLIEPPVVEPVGVFQVGELDLLRGAPGTSLLSWAEPSARYSATRAGRSIRSGPRSHPDEPQLGDKSQVTPAGDDDELLIGS